jgi:hypothetical protein
MTIAAIKERQSVRRTAFSKQWDGRWVGRHGHDKRLLTKGIRRIIRAGHDCEMDTSAWRPRYASLLKWKITTATPSNSPSMENVQLHVYQRRFCGFPSSERKLLKIFTYVKGSNRKCIERTRVISWKQMPFSKIWVGLEALIMCLWKEFQRILMPPPSSQKSKPVENNFITRSTTFDTANA